ncbi:MAG: DUF465 domain-containing protein [Alphaproteobacteria bacterium]|jgi:hypothetical protein|nr:DUF465 domain-containing protein [Candidatus Jidaibacter sp.]
MVNTMKYEKELANLKVEHTDLEKQISGMMQNKVIDQFKMHDLKKKKLMLKEAIIQIEQLLFSDGSAA